MKSPQASRGTNRTSDPGLDQDEDVTVGTLAFNDGSSYTGTLKNGVPDGLGECVWKDGNKYDGEWRNGVMHGFGTFLWTSGQRYDGEWKDGRRDGIGVKVYADGSTYDGFWRDGNKHGVGLFRPPPPLEPRQAVGDLMSGSRATFRRSAPTTSADAHAPLQAIKPVQFASQRQYAVDDVSLQSTSVAFSIESNTGPLGLVADSTIGGPTLPSNKKEVFIRKFDGGRLEREDKLSKQDIKLIFEDLPKPKPSKTRRKRRWVKKALGMGKKLQQKQGQLLYKGMPGYDLMTRLQLGIRHSIALLNQKQQWLATQSRPLGHVHDSLSTADAPIHHDQGAHLLKPPDFTAKNKTFFPSDGSSKTPAHPSSDFKWKDYSPSVFRNLRLLWGISDAEYMLSLAGSKALWQLNSPGKSGCMFFLSDDEKFLVKTMRKSECQTMIEMLPQYYRHIESNPDSLLTRFYGVYGVKQVHGRTVRFVVMSNIFCTDHQIHRKFDLKGSTEGRTSGAADPSDLKSVFKDLDLDVTIHLPKITHQRLMAQLRRDADFLRAIGVMDYSLLLGIHFVRRETSGGAGLAGTSSATPIRPNQRSVTYQESPATGRTDAPGSAGPAATTSSDYGKSEPSPAAAPPTAPRFVSPFEKLASDVGPSSSVMSQGDRPSNADPSTPISIGTPISRIQQNLSQTPSTLASSISVRLDDALADAAAAAAAAAAELSSSPGREGGAGGMGGQFIDRVRNFDVFSNKQVVEDRLSLIEKRMRDASYSDQRISDVLALVKLKILGDTLQKGGVSSRGPKPAAVLKAMQQWRQEAFGLKPGDLLYDTIQEGSPSEDEGEQNAGNPRYGGGASASTAWTGAEADHNNLPLTPGSGGTGGHQVSMERCTTSVVRGHLGYSIPAVAVHKVPAARHGQPEEQVPEPEEVFLYMGIVDFLQDYNTRKLLERGFKGLLHDRYAISVAPPKLYANRFFDFMQNNVFQEEDPSAFPSLQRQGDLRNDFLIPEGDEGDEDDEEEEDIEDDRIS